MDHAHKLCVIYNNEDLVVFDDNGDDHRIWKAINGSRTLLDAYCWIDVEMVQLLDLVEDFELVFTHVLISNRI